MTDHAALRAEIARAQMPVTTRELAAKTLYERAFGMVKWMQVKAVTPAVLETPERLTSNDWSVRCTSIIDHRPQLTSLTSARGLRSDRAVWRSPPYP